MAEDYRNLAEKAVRSVHEKEKIWLRSVNSPFTDEQAKREIEYQLCHNFVESQKGKGSEPVSDDLFKLLVWAQYEYLLLLLNDLRRGAEFRDHKSCGPKEWVEVQP
jgi:hypothetical protein